MTARIDLVKFLQIIMNYIIGHFSTLSSVLMFRQLLTDWTSSDLSGLFYKSNSQNPVILTHFHEYHKGLWDFFHRFTWHSQGSVIFTRLCDFHMVAYFFTGLRDIHKALWFSQNCVNNFYKIPTRTRTTRTRTTTTTIIKL